MNRNREFLEELRGKLKAVHKRGYGYFLEYNNKSFYSCVLSSLAYTTKAVSSRPIAN